LLAVSADNVGLSVMGAVLRAVFVQQIAEYLASGTGMHNHRVCRDW
jgi:hypothetical protein